jgi:hypothetical protein
MLSVIGMIFGWVVEHRPELLGNVVMSQSRPDRVEHGALPLLLMEDRFPLLHSGGISPPRWADASNAGLFAILNGSAAVSCAEHARPPARLSVIGDERVVVAINACMMAKRVSPV